jgi:hypothetical protein
MVADHFGFGPALPAFIGFLRPDRNGGWPHLRNGRINEPGLVSFVAYKGSRVCGPPRTEVY